MPPCEVFQESTGQSSPWFRFTLHVGRIIYLFSMFMVAHLQSQVASVVSVYLLDSFLVISVTRCRKVLRPHRTDLLGSKSTLTSWCLLLPHLFPLESIATTNCSQVEAPAEDTERADERLRGNFLTVGFSWFFLDVQGRMWRPFGDGLQSRNEHSV